jgi:nucleoid DNA-binding protein
MKIVDRLELINRVYDRFGGAIPKLVLQDALREICDDLFHRISDEHSVFVHNFGTFMHSEFKSRQSVDIKTKELRSTKPFTNVTFIPDRVFADMIKQKKDFFNKIEKER